MLTLEEIRMLLLAIYPKVADAKYAALRKKLLATLKKRKITVKL